MSEYDTSDSETTFDGISICEELNDLIERCQEYHYHLHCAHETLAALEKLIDTHRNIIVSFDGWMGDFDELLEKLHKNALDNIVEKGENNFGKQLLNALQTIEFGPSTSK